MGSILASGRSPGEGNGNPLQYSCLENPLDRGTLWATGHGITRSRTQMKRLNMRGRLEAAPGRTLRRLFRRMLLLPVSFLETTRVCSGHCWEEALWLWVSCAPGSIRPHFSTSSRCLSVLFKTLQNQIQGTFQSELPLTFCPMTLEHTHTHTQCSSLTELLTVPRYPGTRCVHL